MRFCLDEKDEIAEGILGCREATEQAENAQIFCGPCDISGENIRAGVVEKDGISFVVARPPLVEPRAVAHILPSVLRLLTKNQRRLDFLRESWLSIVGEDLAKEMFPLGLRNGVLTVGVTSEGLRYEIAAFHAQSLLATIRSSFPEAGIRRVRFVTYQRK